MPRSNVSPDMYTVICGLCASDYLYWCSSRFSLFVCEVGGWPGTVGEDIVLTWPVPKAGSSPACWRSKV